MPCTQTFHYSLSFSQLCPLTATTTISFTSFLLFLLQFTLNLQLNSCIHVWTKYRAFNNSEIIFSNTSQNFLISWSLQSSLRISKPSSKASILLSALTFIVPGCHIHTSNGNLQCVVSRSLSQAMHLLFNAPSRVCHSFPSRVCVLVVVVF